FGPPIRDWRAHGAISRKGKIYASFGMLAAFAAAAYFGAPAWVLALQICILAAVAAFILSRPSPPSTQNS
ncbi:MAG: DUF454 family protein, partial [Pseudomonadota bacterium]